MRIALPQSRRALLLMAVLAALVLLLGFVALRSGPLAPVKVTVVQVEERAISELALGEPCGVPAHEGLDDGQGHVRRGATEDADPAVGARPDEGEGADPSAQALLGRIELGALEQGPGVEEERRGIPVLGDRLGAGGRDDQARAPGHPVEHLLAA